jgi:hypothetical protein
MDGIAVYIFTGKGYKDSIEAQCPGEWNVRDKELKIQVDLSFHESCMASVILSGIYTHSMSQGEGRDE